ncbi:MAG: hypothetical protein DRP58_09325, partial [Spirochaetes bacterium]
TIRFSLKLFFIYFSCQKELYLSIITINKNIYNFFNKIYYFLFTGCRKIWQFLFFPGMWIYFHTRYKPDIDSIINPWFE